MRFLVDSRASHTHAKKVSSCGLCKEPVHADAYRNFSCGPLGAPTDEFPEVFRNLHGIAESICKSNECSFAQFFMVFIEYQVFWIKVINSSQLTCICKASALLLSSAVFLVAALSSTCATRNSGQMFSGLDVPWIFANLTPDHMYP